MSELRGFVYKCDCIKPMIESIIEKLLPLEEITEAYLDPVSLSGITGTILEYKAADKKKSKRLIVTHTFCPFCGKKLLQESERFTVHSDIERQDDKWIPVSERLPEVYRDEDGDFIPFLVCEGDGGYPFVAMYDGINWRAGIFVPDITHWMPLPELPEESKKW